MSIRIRTKIIISFAAIFALLSFLVLTSYYNRNLLFQGTLRLEEKMYEMYVISSVQLNIDRSVMPLNDYLITGEVKEKERFRVVAGEVEKGFDQLKSLGHKEHNAHMNDAMERFAILKEKGKEISAIQNPVGDKRAAQLMQEADSLASDIIMNHLGKVHVAIRSDVAELIDFADINTRKADMLILIGAIISVITVIILIIYLVRSILKPILCLKEGASIIGGGDLDHRIDIRGGLEINLLADEFNRMTSKLKESYKGLEKKVEERTRELNELNKKLIELSITDGLTGLHNHKHFYERLVEEMERARRYNNPLSLIMADIDHFKNYNDTHGHLEGDFLLKELASHMKKSVRFQDIVSRYGGEEFSIILPETGKEGAITLAERIRCSVAEQQFPHKETQPGGNLTISFGVATFPDDARDPETLVERADKALYLAKGMGRNRVEIVPNEVIISP